MSLAEIDWIAAKAVSDAAALGHDMALIGSDRQTRRYECRRCGLGFTLGYKAVVGHDKLSNPGVIAETALTTRCKAAA